MKRRDKIRQAIDASANLTAEQVDKILEAVMQTLNASANELRQRSGPKHSAIDVEYVRSQLSYEPETGLLRWRINWMRRQIGSIAGNLRPQDGYIRVGLRGRAYMAHRVAWLHYHGRWPEAEIDHINNDRADNRITNLREATRQQQLWNTRRAKNGLKGTHMAQDGRWMAQIKLNGKSTHIGAFKTQGEAHEAYVARAKKEFGDFVKVG